MIKQYPHVLYLNLVEINFRLDEFFEFKRNNRSFRLSKNF